MHIIYTMFLLHCGMAVLVSAICFRVATLAFGQFTEKKHQFDNFIITGGIICYSALGDDRDVTLIIILSSVIM